MPTWVFEVGGQVFGLAVGVHTTQFAIRDAGLYRPVLELAMHAAAATSGARPVMVAGIVLALFVAPCGGRLPVQADALGRPVGALTWKRQGHRRLRVHLQAQLDARMRFDAVDEMGLRPPAAARLPRAADHEGHVVGGAAVQGLVEALGRGAICRKESGEAALDAQLARVRPARNREERRGETLVVDSAFVDRQLAGIAKNADLSRYVL